VLHKNQIPDPGSGYRAVRTYVRREGRMTKGQKNALLQYWPRFGIDAGENYLDLDEIFGRSTPRVLEIGLGMGDALVKMALAHPENDYLGVEVYRPGIGALLNKLVESDVTNVRVITEDIKVVLQLMIRDNALDAVFIFFPDPWPKKRHHKRRLIQIPFVELLRDKLKTGGVLHMATDWEDYARHMMRVMSQIRGVINATGDDNFSPRPDYRPLTRFEQRGIGLGHEVRDLIFTKTY
jgi:tRNA (guanine-N7-)-methyltransferase